MADSTLNVHIVTDGATYTPAAMDLADHFRTIAANWWRILLISTIVGAGVYGWSTSQDPTYVGMQLINLTPEVDQGQGIDQATIEIRLSEKKFLLETYELALKAVNDSKLTVSAAELRSGLTIVQNPLSGNILIKSSANTRQLAMAQAGAYGAALERSSIEAAQIDNDRKIKDAETGIAFLKNALSNGVLPAGSPAADEATKALEAQEASLVFLRLPTGKYGVVRLIGTPVLDNSGEPVAPKPIRDGILAFLVAFVVAAESFVVTRALSDRVSKATDVEAITALTGLPVLALVPRGRGPEVVEAFRTLRTNLMFLEGNNRPRTIAILSPNPAAGKSFCAIHLAESAVGVDAHVVLVDADLRRPVLHQRLRTDREPGLADALRGMPLSQTLHRVDGHSNLKLMPSGAPVTDTVAALGGRAFRGVLDSLETAELIIVDTPPGAGYADALAVAAHCDAALLVLDAETTRKRTTKQFIAALDRTGASLIGVVLNGATVNKRDTYER